MKTLNIIVVTFIVTLVGSNSYAQMHDHSKMVNSKTSTDTKMDIASAKTETFKVFGNCGMCKERIEKAAKVEGVTKASWDKTTKLLTLVYDPATVKSDDIQKKIAAVGHDTEKYKADDKVYSKLHGCCQYERKK